MSCPPPMNSSTVKRCIVSLTPISYKLLDFLPEATKWNLAKICVSMS